LDHYCPWYLWHHLPGRSAFPPLSLLELTDPEDAKRGIREYILWKLSQQQLAELKSSGMRVPDTRMALRWKEQTEQVHDTEFLSLEVKRALLVPPLRKRTNFVVRAVIRDTKQQTQTRYFWVNGLISVLNVRESSKLAWHLPI